MLEEELEKLAIRVTIQKAESQTIELKSAHQGFPTRLFLISSKPYTQIDR